MWTCQKKNLLLSRKQLISVIANMRHNAIIGKKMIESSGRITEMPDFADD